MKAIAIRNYKSKTTGALGKIYAIECTPEEKELFKTIRNLDRTTGLIKDNYMEDDMGRPMLPTLKFCAPIIEIKFTYDKKGYFIDESLEQDASKFVNHTEKVSSTLAQAIANKLSSGLIKRAGLGMLLENDTPPVQEQAPTQPQPKQIVKIEDAEDAEDEEQAPTQPQSKQIVKIEDAEDEEQFPS